MSKLSSISWLLTIVISGNEAAQSKTSDISIDDLNNNIDQVLSTIQEKFETVWWDIDYSDTCNAAIGRDLGASPTCSAQYPAFDNFLCYEECPPDHGLGIGKDCYKDCNEGWIDSGLICDNGLPLITVPKDSYQRGVGVPKQPGCAAGKENYGGICYDVCSSGYYADGLSCRESYCPAGYADNGLSCYKFPNIYWKKSYTRTGAVVPSYYCPSSHPDWDGAFCYQRCNSGYYGSATFCYKYCPEDSIERGCCLCELQSPQILTKDKYVRDGGFIPDQCESGYVLDSPGFCYSQCADEDLYEGVGPLCWSKKLGTSIGLIFGTAPILGLNNAACSGILLPQIIANIAVFLSDPERASNELDYTKILDYTACMRPLLGTAKVIDNEWSIDSSTVAYEIGISESYFSNIFESKPFEMQNGHSFMIGIAFNFPKPDEMNIYVYHGQCEFITPDFGGSGITMSQTIYRSPQDLTGKFTYFSLGVDLSKFGIPIGIGGSYGFNDECEVTSMTQSIDISTDSDLPIAVAGGVCLVKDTTKSRVFTNVCRLKILGNDHKWWAGEKIGMYFAIDLDKVDCILGSSLENSSVRNVYYSGTKQIISVRLWRTNNVITNEGIGINYGHGRKNIGASDGDWKIGEYIVLDGVKCNTQCT